MKDILMSIPKIISLATANPPYLCPVEAAVDQAKTWVNQFDEIFQTKVGKIFRNAEVDQRYGILPLDQIFASRSLEEKNAIYRESIVSYSEIVLREALEKAHLNPTDIDCIITTSCTGHMSPSLDAFLVNRLGMRQSIQRLPVMEMGCIGGAVGLIYAENYLRAYPDRYVALISAELTSITFQRDDYSLANIVSTAIFGDGIACAILGPTQENRPAIIGSRMHHFSETTELLGFNLSSSGFHMVLDERLPEYIRREFKAFTEPLLEQSGYTLEDIDHFVVHPGGKKILQNIELILRPYGKQLADSRQVLRQYGNMSSATVLFILQRFLEKSIQPGEKGIILGFGPGLTASAMLLEWRHTEP